MRSDHRENFNMKSVIKYSGLLLTIWFFSSNLQAGGIEFFHGSWDEALAAAKKERRLIFVDAYTVWCGPCKMMSRNTFTDEQVGEFFNQNFINYKFDMEKGEGPTFASRYQVNAYPTLLFIDYRGEVIHRVMGYQPPQRFLEEGKKATDPAKNQALLALQMEAGEASPEDMYAYAINLKRAGEDYSKVATQYFASQSEKALLSPENWKAIQELSTDLAGVEMQYLLKNNKKFGKKYGEKAVREKILQVCKKQTILAALRRDPAPYQQAVKVAQKYLKDDGLTANRLKLTYAEATKDWTDYAYRAIFFFDHYRITDAVELNQAARNFYEQVAEPEKLESALSWCRQAVAIDNSATNNETYARLLYKLNRRQEAIKYANRAVQAALQAQENPEKIEAWIEEISQ